MRFEKESITGDPGTLRFDSELEAGGLEPSGKMNFVQPGQMQSERDFNQRGGTTSPAQLRGQYGRRAADWFSFDLPVDAAGPLVLVVTYSTDERADRAFAVLVDGQKVGEQRIPRRAPQVVSFWAARVKAFAIPYLSYSGSAPKAIRILSLWASLSR